MKLYDTGVYLLNGQKIVPENQADFPVSKEEAAKSTIAYSILKAHNTSGNMEKLQIKFDKLTSHDITFVGIIQRNNNSFYLDNEKHWGMYWRWRLCTSDARRSHHGYGIKGNQP